MPAINLREVDAELFWKLKAAASLEQMSLRDWVLYKLSDLVADTPSKYQQAIEDSASMGIPREVLIAHATEGATHANPVKVASVPVSHTPNTKRAHVNDARITQGFKETEYDDSDEFKQ